MAKTAPDIKIGFIPLTDAAPLIIAKEKGFFEDHGLDVTLSRENSWSRIRDKVSNGELDAAHMLAPMAPASWLGNAYAAEPILTGLSLNLNGNAITVSETLYREMMEADPEAMFSRPTTARALKSVLAKRLKRGDDTITFGAVFPYSSHYFAIRYWLGAEGINPDRDIRMVVAPPAVMVEQLEQGLIDAFCVGEPWNSLAEYRGSGRAIIRSSEIWSHMPEKILGVRARWAEENPETHLALIRSVLSACQWLDYAKNRTEAASVLSSPSYVGVNANVLATALSRWGAIAPRRSVLQSNDTIIFHHYAANFPWRSHAMWFLTQMVRWGQVTAPLNILDIAQKAYRPDIYRQAAEALGVNFPTQDMKIEGIEDRSWLLEGNMGPIAMSENQFIDRIAYNPSQLTDYLEQFMRHNLRILPDAIYEDAHTVQYTSAS